MQGDSAARRFLEYKNILRKLKSLGFTRVFSSNLADTLGISASLVRKDFLNLTTVGNKRGGYKITELLNEINSVLCKEKETKAAIVGIGKLGSALLNYKNFADEHIRFAAAFDIEVDKLGITTDVPLYHVDQLTEIIKKNKIEIGVLTVPALVVQRIADLMVLAGVKGFLNFAPIRLKLPNGCYENQINLAIELERVVLEVANIKNL